MFVFPVFAQLDTGKVNVLEAVTIKATKKVRDISRLSPVEGTFITSGKKNEVILLTEKPAAISEKYARQIFAKVPGVFVYDMDGTGNQLNIAARGLDPHRGWEFNLRKDGVITNTDMYGYPASHYNIPMEAVEQIQIIRGTGSLQYGAQFGGMINYISKGPGEKPLTFESINTVGSNGLVSTFNMVGGKIGKFGYTGWINKKWLNGYRDFSNSEYDAESISVFYQPNDDFKIKLDWSHSNYIIQLAGPLTDAMFEENPRQATRTRNYYNPTIHIPSITMDWSLSPRTLVRFVSSAVLGDRNSVLFDRLGTIPDTIVSSTLQYNNRQVDIDHFRSLTSELRIAHQYNFLKNQNTLSGGIQYMNNDLHRLQQGKGTTGTDFDLTLVEEGWGRDMHFKTSNIALYAENRWVLTSKLSLNTGVRYETGKSNLTGKTTYYPEEEFPNTIEHNFPLFGLNLEYALNAMMNIYAGWSQAYRPVILKDIVPGSVTETTDKDLKDARGYTAEVGYRGKTGILQWDVTGFYMDYRNRLGTFAQKDGIILRTNIGNSIVAGIEIFAQADFDLSMRSSLSLFTSTAIQNGEYRDAIVRSGNENVSIDGNKVESVPGVISRNGVVYKFGQFRISGLYSYTANTYADALNAELPNPSGATGLVPAYGLLDINASYKFNDNVMVQLNVNNLLDEQYFTKRPQFYPGPGIWPSDGRTISASFALKF